MGEIGVKAEINDTCTVPARIAYVLALTPVH
jgi:hypothetical protein